MILCLVLLITIGLGDALCASFVDVTIFVHGTQGSSFLIFNPIKTKNDHLEEAKTYKALQAHYRACKKNKNNIEKRFIGDIGLHRVTFDNTEEVSWQSFTKLALQLYLTINQEINKKRDKQLPTHHFYQFGWNGLLSQRERQKEALRFYNELVGLIDHYEREGVTPRIHICAHSHGGNIVLCLAGIWEIVNKRISLINNDPCFLQAITMLEDALFKDKSHVRFAHECVCPEEYNYYMVPTKERMFYIEDFFMFGTPIQNETEHLVKSSLFKKVCLLYSENDIVPSLDIFSTNGVSRRCFTPTVLKNKTSLIQARLTTYNQEKTALNADRGGSKTKHYLKNLVKTIPLVLRGGHINGRHLHDPTHADWWQVGERHPDVFYEGIPLVVLTPFIKHAIDQLIVSHHGEQDVTIHIYKDRDYITGFLKNESCVMLPMNAIEFCHFQEMREKINLITKTINMT